MIHVDNSEESEIEQETSYEGYDEEEKLDPDDNHTLLVADSWGRIHTIILNPLIEYLKIPIYSELKYNLNRYKLQKKALNRKDNLNADSLSEGYLKKNAKLNRIYHPEIIIYEVLVNRTWGGHTR